MKIGNTTSHIDGLFDFSSYQMVIVGAFPMTNPCIRRLVLSTYIFVCCTFSISYYPILPSGKLTFTMWNMIILVGESSINGLWAIAYIAILVYQRVSPLILFSILSDYPIVSSKHVFSIPCKKQPFIWYPIICHCYLI